MDETTILGIRGSPRSGDNIEVLLQAAHGERYIFLVRCSIARRRTRAFAAKESSRFLCQRTGS